jgi:L-iditol 2-dehydrogenase
MNLCSHQQAIGYRHDGGFSPCMIVPASVPGVDVVNRIPGRLSFAEASIAEPLACVLNAQELAWVGEGDDVVIVGAGPTGCLHARLARSRGADASS